MESPYGVGLLYVVLVFILLASRMWIATALGLVGIFGLYVVSGGGVVTMIGPLLFNSTNQFVYTMIPMFVFMGELFQYSQLGGRLYEGTSEAANLLPGGLLHSNIISCAVFSAVSGSSMATAATVGTVAIPEMTKRGYNKRLLYGSLAAGGTLGILIPPSLSLVIYGAFVGESISQLFIAAIIPGVLCSGLFMVYIATACTFYRSLAPKGKEISGRRMIVSVVKVWPIFLVFFMVLGTIYFGIATPTEAAALGACTTLVLCILYSRMSWDILKSSLLSALQVSCFLMLIILSAYILSMAISMAGIPTAMAEAVNRLGLDRHLYWAVLVVMYIILGCFIDGVSIMLLTLPVVYPVMMSLGYSSLWLGIVMTICIEMGQITPPVGVNLFVIHGLTGRKDLKEIIMGSLPFVLVLVMVLVILTVFPSLVTWLPSLMVQKFG